MRKAEIEAWRKRDLSEADYVYVRAAGLYVIVRLGDQVDEGYRESAESWTHVRELTPRGMRARGRRRRARLLGRRAGRVAGGEAAA